MTEKEYLAQVKAVRKHITDGRLEYADELLTRLYAYKPVRLLWFVAKAEYVLAKEGDPAAALKVLDGERYADKKYFLGEDYPGLKACMNFRINTFRQMGRELDAIREEYCYQRACGKWGSRLEEARAKAVEAYAEDSGNMQTLSALGEAFYQTSDMVSYFIIHMAMRRQGLLEEDDKNEWFYQIPNFGYLEERLCGEAPQTFVLIMDEHLGQELEVLGFLLHSMGHKVYLLSPPLAFETEERLELGDTLAVSLDNAERYPDMCVIPPVVLTQGDEPYGDNRDYIIDHICRSESGNDLVTLLCGGGVLDGLYREGPLRGRLGRLSPYETDFQEEKLQFGWAGDYLSYISNIYGYDVRPDIEAKPEVDFSIVIPARNSAKTLRYTLETCLKQRYTGSYEIVVSDNSVEGSTEVYDLCQELGNPKIRYVKTPRSLSLTKSFEFAYLQTRGEFVLSIGSDDGVLPWALDVLKRVLSQFPQEEIIQWDRGFYAWPGFNGGQENMFQIPQAYEKDKIGVYFEKTSDIFEEISKDVQSVYLMPLLYINSGFRRRYLKTLLQKTGKLLDGGNQDLQTGVINCCINDQILKMVYPITIAGMSSSSIGYVVSSSGSQEEKQKTASAVRAIYQWANLGTHVPVGRQRNLMPVGIDSCSLFYTLSDALNEGLITKEVTDKVLDWSTALLQTMGKLSLLKEICDLFIHKERYIAKQLGEAKWFDERFYINAVAPQYIDESALNAEAKKKSYQEGKDSEGGETLDASKYGVQNIAGAVELFARKIEGS